MKWKSKKENGKFVAIAMLVQRTGLCAGRALLIVQPGTEAQ